MRGAARDSIGACLLRLGVLPLLMLAAARWLPCPVELRRVMLIQAAMPCAVIPVILAKHYGGDPAMALRIILCTSAAGLLTIPWWIQLGNGGTARIVDARRARVEGIPCVQGKRIKAKSGHFDRSAGGKMGGAEWRNL